MRVAFVLALVLVPAAASSADHGDAWHEWTSEPRRVDGRLVVHTLVFYPADGETCDFDARACSTRGDFRFDDRGPFPGEAARSEYPMDQTPLGTPGWRTLRSDDGSVDLAGHHMKWIAGRRSDLVLEGAVLGEPMRFTSP